MMLLLPILAVGVMALAAETAAPPPTPIRPVIDLVHGRPISDPYRWLERLDDPEVAAWTRAQGDYTRRRLATALADSTPDETPVPSREIAIQANRFRRLSGGRAMFLARRADDAVDALYLRSADGDLMRVFAPSPGPDGKAATIAFFEPAPDGTRVAIALGSNGSEDNALSVLDSASGRLVEGPIPGVRFDEISWWPDGRRFAYPRLREADGNRGGKGLYAEQQVYSHTLGSDWHDDPPLFGRAVASSANLPEGDFPAVEIHAEAGLAFGRHAAGVAQEFGLYVAPLASLDHPPVRWRRLFGADAGYGAPRAAGSAPIVVARGQVYLTHLAGQGAIHRIDLAAPDRPAVQFADPDGVVLGLAPAADGLYVQVQQGMRQHLVRIVPGRAGATPVRLPFDGQFELVPGEPRLDGVVLRDRQWTTRSRYWLVRRDVATELAIVPLPADGIALAAEEVDVTSVDGTRVPLSIVHPRDWNGATAMPYLLTGYAAYGITMQPVFNDNLLPIYRDGIGYAVCHARGGGEFGDRWHRAAMKATKHLGWEDFIACAEWLIAHGHTRADRLLAEGASAGGLMVGRAMTERPDLFAGVHLAFGGLNPMRAETHANGAPNVAEFGSIADPDEARWILDMDTYHHVAAGVAYPAVLLTHGWNDARTPFWASAKTAARLQASSTSGKPVLMNIDFAGGHQIVSGPEAKVHETKALIRAFFHLVAHGPSPPEGSP